MIEQQRIFLDGFRRAFELATGRELRREPRHPGRACARLAWGEAAETCQVPARVVDISRGGAALSVRLAPPTTGPVRLSLEGVGPGAGIEARVLAVVADAWGWHRVRLQFLDPCPDALLDAARADLPAGAPRATEPGRAPIVRAG